MGRKKPTAREEDNTSAAPQAGGKSKKKAVVIDDDEYSIGTELSVDQSTQEEKVAAVTGKKKNKKGGSKHSQLQEEDEDKLIEGNEEDDAPEVVFMGKKKSKSKSKKNGSSSLFSTSSFGLLEEEDKDDEQSCVTVEKDGVGGSEGEDEPITFSGKKKPSKSNKKSNSLFKASTSDDLEDSDEDLTKKEKPEEEVDDGAAADLVTFSGKKKKSSKSTEKKSNLFSVALLDEENEIDDSVSAQDSATKPGDDPIEDENAPVISFSGKKKSSKKKNNSTSTSLVEAGLGEEIAVVESEESTGTSLKETGNLKSIKQANEGPVETSKNKKKKKKSGRTAQEEDDLDKLLAELGEMPPMSKPTVPPQEKAEVLAEPIGVADPTAEKEGEEESIESAAAKKKKKKKEKEKEKKAAAAAAASVAELKEEKPEKKDEMKSKVSDKKIPKHVREKQEALARRKEAEEKKQREEEEKLRKEEEERLRQEELVRQAEEARRRKKEKEKEKLLKKKQEGRLLTGKQKDEARRLESMRNQILANAGGLPLAATDSTAGAMPKRPIYRNKKIKLPSSHGNGVASVENVEPKESMEEAVPEVDLLEIEKVEVDSVGVDEQSEIAVAIEDHGVEEEEEDDEEWDAKSWDDAVLNLPGKSAFADEEVEFKPEPPAKKEVKSLKQTSVNGHVASKKVTSPPPIKSQDVEHKNSQPEVEAASRNKKKEVGLKSKSQKADSLPKETEDNLRSPICCIMGHVDTGKTKLLDCIRRTNVQEGEAGGITQQIGATYFPAENIRERTRELKADAKLKVPGLLVIDTPGHESFTNLRSRGSGLCDIAILVVDIMHGLENQTIESINLLKMRNTEFIVALNKVDRLYGWKVCRNAPIIKAMKQQSTDVLREFNMRLDRVILQLKEQSLNTELYYKNKEMGETFSIVPTSAISGEGIPDLLLLLCQWTQKTMVEKLTFSNEVQCTVLEVKVIEGHGTTVDVVLVNGVLHEGDQIVVCGMQGPIVTTIRALLTPHPMKELRVKGTYLHHKEIKAAQGIKITGQGFEHAVAGTALYVVGPDDDVEDVKETAMEDMKSVMSRIDKSGEGVYVQASTLGSLEALLEFLKSPAVKIPVCGIGIGPVHKKDVMKASVMLEKKKEFATILAFDVKVTPEARELADDTGVKIFIADIIYHLFDQFKAYIDDLKEEKKKEAADEAVFPCVLSIIPNCVFNKKDPIVLGVDVLEGIAKVGTPICIPQKDFIDIGRIASIEFNHKPVDSARKGQKVAIKIVGSSSDEQQKMFGRHFEIDDELVSHISRRSIDVLRANYREDLSMDDWRLVLRLKNIFRIQ